MADLPGFIPQRECLQSSYNINPESGYDRKRRMSGSFRCQGESVFTLVLPAMVALSMAIIAQIVTETSRDLLSPLWHNARQITFLMI